jgi:hypothetical protein
MFKADVKLKENSMKIKTKISRFVSQSRKEVRDKQNG